MCNLYRLATNRDELAHLFGALEAVAGGNAPDMVYPGYPGMVVADGRVQQMTWGFPLARTGAKGQPLKPKPVNNARMDKLGSPFWKASFRDRRCLIPLTAFAEAVGQRGAMTRTWFSLPEAPTFAVAGFWRPSAEFGDAFTMVMTDANETVRPVHDRMPVILAPADWPAFLGEDPQAAFDLCVPYAGAMDVARTDERWAGSR